MKKSSVSEQGIVSAILKSDTAMKVICYDTAGNILVDNNITSRSGYPVDVALSANGQMMQVLYLYTQDHRWTISITLGMQKDRQIIRLLKRTTRTQLWHPDFLWMRIHRRQLVTMLW